ncbi:hypothetical protein [Rhodopila sp.]|uniref:hypothetical protein n=1 Tax=Rhodopila sp. TaxID=2480087 RepID=UPI003D14F3F7
MSNEERGLFEAMLHRLELIRVHAEEQNVLLEKQNVFLQQFSVSLEGLRSDLRSSPGRPTDRQVRAQYRK